MGILIGSCALDDPVILAPMSGITDRPFRRLVARLGVGMAVTEMIASRELLRGTRESLRRLGTADDADGPFAVQLAGCDPGLLADAARFNQDRGADIIDINMGCPVKKVVGGQGGSALMRDEALAGRILERTAAAVSIPVTVKMRLGWDDGARNAPRLARMAEAAGIQAVTVHGRTREQRFEGEADWTAIAAVKDAVSIPVIANGDIRRARDAAECLRRSGADAVMIGRGAQGRPWFPSQVAALLRGLLRPSPDPRAQAEIMLAHYRDMLMEYGTERGPRIARKHLGWYGEALSLPADLRARLMREGEAHRVEAVLARLAGNDGPGLVEAA